MSPLLLCFVSLALAGDTGFERPEQTQPLHGTDTDEDSWPDNMDCAAEDPGIFPGATELCNGLDDDCDGEVDDLKELCNGLDDDCDGQVDETAECKACGGEREQGSALVVVPALLWGARRRR